MKADSPWSMKCTHRMPIDAADKAVFSSHYDMTGVYQNRLFIGCWGVFQEWDIKEMRQRQYHTHGLEDKPVSVIAAQTTMNSILIGTTHSAWIFDSRSQYVEEKFPKENFRVNREMRDEILVYDLFLAKFLAKMASKCRENCVKI